MATQVSFLTALGPNGQAISSRLGIRQSRARDKDDSRGSRRLWKRTDMNPYWTNGQSTLYHRHSLLQG